MFFFSKISHKVVEIHSYLKGHLLSRENIKAPLNMVVIGSELECSQVSIANFRVVLTFILFYFYGKVNSLTVVASHDRYHVTHFGTGVT